MISIGVITFTIAFSRNSMRLRAVQFLGEQLTSSEYIDALKRDLEQAEVCRFVVAYVSDQGIEHIGRHNLLRALKSDKSFGVSSLSCCCGYDPLVTLQMQLGGFPIRLRYFMDPQITRSDEPNGIALLHSKLVYLYIPERCSSVAFIGSHNWTHRALGADSPRNVEASIRLELPFSPEHLLGSGDDIVSQINRHLLTANQLAACLPASPAFKPVFDQWVNWSCKSAPPPNLDLTTVILAAGKSDISSVSPSEWEGLQGHSIYLQIFEERDGSTIRDELNQILVLIWPSRGDLAAGRQPMLLRCHHSTQDPGPHSSVHGSNTASVPIAGFQAVLFNEATLHGRLSAQSPPDTSVRLWSGCDVDVFDFDFPTAFSDSANFDRGLEPTYRFLLEVDQVVFPADGKLPSRPSRVWTRDSLAFAASKKDAKLQQVPGYAVDDELRHRILACLKDELGVNLRHAKTKPVMVAESLQAGRRVSSHLLHDAFIPPDSRERPLTFYETTKRDLLVANINSSASNDAARLLFPPTLGRVSRLYTSTLAELEDNWIATAAKYRAMS